MTVIPVTVFFFVIAAALGGPSAFVNRVASWVVDLVSYFSTWIKYL
jgi:hypothetical protein